MKVKDRVKEHRIRKVMLKKGQRFRISHIIVNRLRIDKGIILNCKSLPRERVIN